MKAAVRGLYAITPDIADTDELLVKAEAALAGGAALLQYRNKAAAPALQLEQARALRALCLRYGVPFIVNDHLDLALAAGADGLHLGKEDGALGPARRRLGPGRLLGATCHDRLEDARAAVAAGADYVAFGSFFASAVKPGAVRAPLELLARAKAQLAVPVVAIGGITLANAPQLIAAGADALAVISALFGAPDVRAAARRFRDLFASRL